MNTASNPLRLAIVADLLEERWPSMDLVAEMLFSQLTAGRREFGLDVAMLRPSLGRQRHTVTATPGLERPFDRFLHRFWGYSMWLRARARWFDVFHVVDHSYAHLVHVLPAHKTVVTCHDVDAFLSIVQPELTTSKMPSLLARLVLSGMRKAAYVTCDSQATYDDIRRYGLIPEERLVIVPNGTHPSFSEHPSKTSDEALARMLEGRKDDVIELLHVGTTIPRKRIDVLLHVLAAVRAVRPDVRLLKAGGTFTGEQRELVRSLGLERSVVELPFLGSDELASLYRRAAMVLVTSDREGFGLPVAEAMACGTPVVATDLPVLREVGGSAAVYCPIGDIPAWRDVVLSLIQERRDPAARSNRRTMGLKQAGAFTWDKYAGAMAGIYARMATRQEPVALNSRVMRV